MSEQSAKPYLIRAICEWCADNALSPYLAVKVNAQTRVPLSFVNLHLPRFEPVRCYVAYMLQPNS